MARLPILFIALCLWAISGLAHAQVVFNAESATVSLNGKMQFLPDNTKRLSLALFIEPGASVRLWPDRTDSSQLPNTSAWVGAFGLV